VVVDAEHGPEPYRLVDSASHYGAAMEQLDYLDHLRRSSGSLAATAAASLDAAVPGCPGWDVADLAYHVGRVDDFWTAMATGGDPEQYARPPQPPDDEVVAWFTAQADRLADTLAAADPTAPAWSFWGMRDVAFVRRRIAHETAVHAWDATDAAGSRAPIDAALAVDGIDEYFEIFVPLQAGRPTEPVTTVHLHATDADGEWLVSVGGGRFEVERSHAKGDVAVRGSASDLLLLLWNRIDLAADGLAVFGDEQAFAVLGGTSD
jgi:uncharacterized protein (TIGR03083 family)